MQRFKYLGSKESAKALWQNREALNKYLAKLRDLMCVKIHEVIPVFVDEIPADLESEKLYISKKYSIAMHLCACGCGGKTVTPLGSGEWNLTETDSKVTLRPSVGNWSGENPYHAHYYITDNKIQWL